MIPSTDEIDILEIHSFIVVLAWTRHVFANGSDCPVLASYQMWFGQKLFKNAKKPEMADFGAARSGFHKIAKSSLFYC